MLVVSPIYLLLSQVHQRSPYRLRCISEQAETTIAALANSAPDNACVMAMVDVDPSISSTAYFAWA